MEKIVARKFRNTIPLFKESQSAFSYIAGKARAGGRGGGMANKLTYKLMLNAYCVPTNCRALSLEWPVK